MFWPSLYFTSFLHLRRYCLCRPLIKTLWYFLCYACLHSSSPQTSSWSVSFTSVKNTSGLLDISNEMHIFFMARQPPVGQRFLIVEFSRLHSEAQHSAGLLWTSGRPVAKTSTWQNTTLTVDRHSCPRWDSNPQSQQANGRRPTP